MNTCRSWPQTNSAPACTEGGVSELADVFADARTAKATDRCGEGFDDRLAAECRVEPPGNGEDEDGEN